MCAFESGEEVSRVSDTCDVVSLGQKMEAAYYDNIIEQQRIEPEFFRMGFYGRKFPFFLRVRPIHTLNTHMYTHTHRTNTHHLYQ